MNLTGIEWAQNPDGSQGYTLNPITGCLNHTFEGLCKGGLFPCYAWKLAYTRLGERYLSNTDEIAGMGTMTNFELNMALKDPFWPRFWPERMREIPHNWKTLTGEQKVKSRGIFLCDMGDLFGDGVREDWTREILNIIRDYPQHRFYLLTKKPENLQRFNPFPDNAWVGITATNEVTFQLAMKHLPYVQAQVKYLSFEPLLSRILTTPGQLERYVDWLIIGACTGSLADMQALRGRYSALEVRDNKTFTKYVAVPPPAWVREIITAADAANVPVFIKDNILDTAWGDYRLTEGRRDFPK
jgi:protein gp37